MTVYVLIREDQNDFGYIDTSIAGVFRDEHGARECRRHERRRARSAGLVVEEEDSDGDWQVSWSIQEQSVRD